MPKTPGCIVGARNGGASPNAYNGNDNGDDSRPPLIHRIVEHHWFQSGIDIVIVLNTALIVYEADLGAYCVQFENAELAQCSIQNPLVQYANLMFLCIYIMEIIIKLYAHHLSFFSAWTNCFDFIVVLAVVTCDIAGIQGNVGILRIARVTRILKAVKASSSVEEVKVFISGIGSAFTAIVVGGVLMGFSIFVFAIAAVILVHPVNVRVAATGIYEASGCERCAVAYSSVSQAMLTLLQTAIMGDGWGEYNLEIINAEPWTVIVFILSSITVSFGLANLVIAVICDRALATRDFNMKKEAALKLQQVMHARNTFVALCRDLDQDNSGQLCLDEFLQGYDNEYFRDTLTLLDIEREDLKIVFELMDKDKDDKLSYEEFSVQLHNLKSQDIHTMTSFIKYYVLEIHEMHAELSKHFGSANVSMSQNIPTAPGDLLPIHATEKEQEPRKTVREGALHALPETKFAILDEKIEPKNGENDDQRAMADLEGVELEALLRTLDCQADAFRQALLNESDVLVSSIRACLGEARRKANSSQSPLQKDAPLLLEAVRCDKRREKTGHSLQLSCQSTARKVEEEHGIYSQIPMSESTEGIAPFLPVESPPVSDFQCQLQHLRPRREEQQKPPLSL